MYCSKCGCEIKEGGKFCGNCGTPVQNQMAQNYTAVDQSAGERQVQGYPGQYPQMTPQGYAGSGTQQQYNSRQYNDFRYVNRPQPAPLTRKKRIMNVIFVVVCVIVIVACYGYLTYRTYVMTMDALSPVIDEFEEVMEDYDDYGYEEYEDEEEEASEDYEIEYVHVDAPDYEGPYNYYKDESWYVSAEGLIVNSKGETNDKLLGQELDSSTNRSMTEGMILTEEGFFYVNAEGKAVEFAPGAKCAELAFDGGTMFYVISDEKESEGDEEPGLGTLYLFDTATGLSEMLEENVIDNSPVISPDGRIVAYTRLTGADTYSLFIAGHELEEKKIADGHFLPCSVNNEGNLFYTDKDQKEIYRYKNDEAVKVHSGEAFNNYFVDSDVDEILLSSEDGTYYCDSEMEQAALMYEGSLVTNMHTPGIHQAYGQFWARLLDVKSLKDLFFISKSSDVFFINPDGKSALVLKEKYDDIDNIVFDCVSRGLLYCYNGVLYKAQVEGDGIDEEVLYDEKDVSTFIAGDDLKNIWLLIDDDICYLKGKEAVTVVPDYLIDSDNEGLLFVWNVEDNKLYFYETETLYSVYDSESSTEKVADDVYSLFKIYGKLCYLSTDDSLYLNINGEFVKVYDGY